MPAKRSPESATAMGRLARLSRADKNDTEALADARREFATCRIIDYINKFVSEAPPLREEQLARIVGILTGATTSAGGA